MTQTPFIPAIPKTPQPVHPQSSQAAAPKKEEFSSHLEKAASRIKKQDVTDNQEHKDTVKNSSKDEQGKQTVSAQTGAGESNSENNNNLTPPSNGGQENSGEIIQSFLCDQPTKSSTLAAQKPGIFVQSDDTFLPNSDKFSKVSEDLQSLDESVSQKTLQQPSVADQKLSIDLEMIRGQQSVTATQQQNALENQGMVQLQQVIANSNEQGTVSIQGSVSAFSLQQTETAAPVKTSQLESAVKNPQLRQDIHGHFLEAKLNLNNHKDNETGKQSEDFPGGRNHLQANSANSTESSLNLIDQTEELQSFSSILQTTRPDSTAAIAKPVTLPGGTVVYENKIMDQVADHFRMNRTVHDSKITIKLHPAELGELKIDIAMKEGNIKAHIIAQNQQVQDIVEKNMVKLRSILEEQGYSLTDIAVSTDSDSVTDFNFFDQHLSQQNDQSRKTIPPHRQENFTQVLEDAVGVTGTNQFLSGVNITA